MEGINKKYTLPTSFEKNVHAMTSIDRENEGIESLPQNMWEAIQITEKSSLVKNSLGEQVFNSFIKNKKIEWEAYSSQVSQYELDRYLTML